MSVTAHPLADLLPRMSGSEYIALRDSIRADGLFDAITLHEGKVLDGRHRLKACVEAGVEPRFAEYAGDSPAAFVLAANVTSRRHLSASQKAMLATEFLPALEAEARGRMASAGASAGPNRPTQERVRNPAHPSEKQRASDDAAKAVGVGSRTVEQAKRVTADPELAGKVRDGQLTVNAAEKRLKLVEHVQGDEQAEQAARDGRPERDVLAQAAERGSEMAQRAQTELRHQTVLLNLRKAWNEIGAVGLALDSLQGAVESLDRQETEARLDRCRQIDETQASIRGLLERNLQPIRRAG